jgi:AcrR family transcriptional regulator
MALREHEGGQRGGRWAGVPLSDRRSRRRDELLAAGVAVLGASDRPALTVRAVCRQAGLTERYFYESFTDRDEFARAVYDDVCTSAMNALSSAATPREAVERFVTLMVDDPVRGRVLLLVPQTEPALLHSGPEWMPSFIALVQNKLTTIADPAVQNMVATGLIGALTALFTAYLSGALAVSREQFIDHCVDMLLTQAGQAAARR